jgi:hypothetical protein
LIHEDEFEYCHPSQLVKMAIDSLVEIQKKPQVACEKSESKGENVVILFLYLQSPHLRWLAVI